MGQTQLYVYNAVHIWTNKVIHILDHQFYIWNISNSIPPIKYNDKEPTLLRYKKLNFKLCKLIGKKYFQGNQSYHFQVGHQDAFWNRIRIVFRLQEIVYFYPGATNIIIKVLFGTNSNICK